MNEQMAQMMMQMMLNNQQMTQMMFQLMTQPQPNPVQETQSQIAATPTPQMMAQTGAAATNIIANGQGEMTDLKQQLEDLKAQMAELQAQNQQLKEQNAALQNAASASVVSDASGSVLEKVKELEKLSGKSLDEIVESVKKNKKIVPKSGRGAYEAYKQMIDEGKLDRDTILYTDSEDVLEAIEEATGTDKTVEEVLEKAKENDKKENESAAPAKKKNIKMEPANGYGF